MKLKVAVIFGGESVEHDISIISASQAIKALDIDKYEVIPIYMSKDREFYVGEKLNSVSNFSDIDKLLKESIKVTLVRDNNKVYIEPIKRGLFSKRINNIDVVVPVVHGTNGEDGSLQGYLEMMKLPYTSSSVISSGVGQDKVIMKYVLEGAGIKIVDWFWIYSSEIDEKKKYIKEKANEIGYPLIIKPACLGSSIGIEFADNYNELLEAIESCSKYDEKIIIEKKLENFREINCSILGSHEKLKTSVLEEVNKDGTFLNFNEKYMNGSKGKNGMSKGMASTNREVPAKLSKKLEDEIKSLAIKTFKQIDSFGVCRVDFMLKDDVIYVSEINNIPGSLSFYLWKENGLDFSSLMDELINMALNKSLKKSKMVYSYSTSVLSKFNFSSTKGRKL